MDNQAIVIQNLTKSFKDFEVLKGVDLSVVRGTMTALLGPNGAGKTTIIRILSTLLPHDSGKAYVNGHEVGEHPEKVRENIGLTGQYAAVDEYLTGKENLEMMGRLYHLTPTDAKNRAEELLGQFDLVWAADRAVKTYSGGMRRRLDLALSLIAAPPVLFLDEPTTGLDPRSRLAMWEIINSLKEANATILLTTQYLEEADKLADRIAVIDNGKIIAQGTSAELKSQVGNERLELAIKPGDFAKAVAAMSSEDLQTDDKQKTLSLATNGSVREIKNVLDKLQSVGVGIESMTLRKPTLDDVFLELTGHRAAEQVQEEGAGE